MPTALDPCPAAPSKSSLPPGEAHPPASLLPQSTPALHGLFFLFFCGFFLVKWNDFTQWVFFSFSWSFSTEFWGKTSILRKKMFINIHTTLSSQLLGLYTYVVLITHRLPGMPAEVLTKAIDSKGVWHFASSATQYHGHANGFVIPNLTLLTRCLRILVSGQFSRQHSVELLQDKKQYTVLGILWLHMAPRRSPGQDPRTQPAWEQDSQEHLPSTGNGQWAQQDEKTRRKASPRPSPFPAQSQGRPRHRGDLSTFTTGLWPAEAGRTWATARKGTVYIPSSRMPRLSPVGSWRTKRKATALAMRVREQSVLTFSSWFPDSRVWDLLAHF